MAFDSSEYAWSDLQVVIGSETITGITGIKYSVSRTVTKIYGAGDEPIAKNKGNKEYTGEIKLRQSELEALVQSAQATFSNNTADPTDVTFDVIVTYAKDVSSLIVSDVLENCDITEFSKEINQNDPAMEITLPIDIGKIKYNQ